MSPTVGVLFVQNTTTCAKVDSLVDFVTFSQKLFETRNASDRSQFTSKLFLMTDLVIYMNWLEHEACRISQANHGIFSWEIFSCTLDSHSTCDLQMDSCKFKLPNPMLGCRNASAPPGIRSAKYSWMPAGIHNVDERLHWINCWTGRYSDRYVCWECTGNLHHKSGSSWTALPLICLRSLGRE